MKERLVLALLVFALAAPLVAQSQEDPAKTVDKTITTGKQTQKKQDEWADEKSDLMVRYRNASANIAYLERRVAIENEKSTALDERIAEMERRLDESTRLRNSIQDTLDVVQQRLEAWVVGNDIPFLMRERKARLVALDKELSRPEVTSADKLRRLLEVLQIETAYGTTVEVLQDRIEVDGEEIFVDMLKLGRLALFWRTPDGERAGEYDLAIRSWVELPEKHYRDIADAMDMAARIRPVEVTELPLGRIAR